MHYFPAVRFHNFSSLELLNAGFLIIFVFEIALLLYAFRIRFFRNIIYCLDLGIISASLFADLYVPHLGTKGQHAFELLLRVWRVLRVAHGVYLIMEDRRSAIEKKLHVRNNKYLFLFLSALSGFVRDSCMYVYGHFHTLHVLICIVVHAGLHIGNNGVFARLPQNKTVSCTTS